MSRTQRYEWFKRFKERTSVSEDTRPDRPSTSADDYLVERVREVIRGNRLTVREVAEEVGLPCNFNQKTSETARQCKICPSFAD